MKKSNLIKKRFGFLLLPIGCFIVLAVTAMSTPQFVAQFPNSWSTPVILSTSTVSETVYSWFPDIAVDEFGTVHVVWCTTVDLSNTKLEHLSYTHQTRTGWSQPNDIIPPAPRIVRNAITTDLNGHVLLLYGGSAHGISLAQYFAQANVDDAWSAHSWMSYIQVNRGASYMGDIAVDSHGVIHIIYDDTIQYQGQEGQVNLPDMYYRKSIDGGLNWSTPVDFLETPQTGAARPYLKIDSNDIIHVTWDEGWDRLTGIEAKSLYSVYIYSKDGGESWSTPKIISYPNGTPEQLAVGSTNTEGVMLVWRSKSDQNVYYQWSSDAGATWSEISAIHGIFARPWTTPYDMYDMATDSKGNIHLILVGQPNENDTIPGVYHLIWNGKWWSNPEKIFWLDNLYPEYPKIQISNGNQIHAVWFTRKDNQWSEFSDRQIWYSRSQTDAPTVPSIPRPTPTVPPPTVTRTPRPSATSQPTISSAGIEINSPTKEKEYLRSIVVALLPAALLLGVITLITLARSHNRL